MRKEITTNAAVDEALLFESLPARFQTAALDFETVRAIPPGEFDVALVLSVLHHVTHARGIGYVSELMAELLSRIPWLVLEPAHRQENVRYARRNSLPDNPPAILSACGNVKLRMIGHSPSHLSGTARPIYLVTR